MFSSSCLFVSVSFCSSALDALLGLAQPALRVVHPLLGLGAGLLGLGQRGVQRCDEVVDLGAVVAAQDDGEVGLRVGVVEEREREDCCWGIGTYWQTPQGASQERYELSCLITWSTRSVGRPSPILAGPGRACHGVRADGLVVRNAAADADGISRPTSDIDRCRPPYASVLSGRGSG